MKIIIEKKNIFNLLLILCSCLFILYLGGYRMLEKPGLWFGDEIGYFSSAAYISGFDWSEQVSNQLGYFGVGYGVFLLPGFWFCNSLLQLMHYIVGLNVVFLLFSFLLGVRLLLKVNDAENYFIACLSSIVSTLYVNNLVQIQMGWTESLNVLLYWLALNIFYDITKKNTYLSYFEYSLVLSYSVIVHMRNITLAFIGAIVLLFWMIKTKVINYSKLSLFLICTFFMIIIFFCSKNIMQNAVWNVTESGQINDISGYTKAANNIAQYITVSSIIDTIFSKMFYILSTTFGLIILGLIYALKNSKNIINLFALSIFFANFLWTAYNMMFPLRYDAIFYARYYEPSIGLLLAYGVWYIATYYKFGRWDAIICWGGGILYKISFLIASNVSDKTVEAGYTSGAIFPCMSGFGRYLFEKGISNVPNAAFQDAITKISLIIFILFIGRHLKKNYTKCILAIIVSIFVISNWISSSRFVVDKIISFEEDTYSRVNPISENINYEWNSENTSISFYTSGEYDVSVLYLQLLVGKNSINNIFTKDDLKNTEGYIVVYKGDTLYENKIQEVGALGELIAETESLALYLISNSDY